MSFASSLNAIRSTVVEKCRVLTCRSSIGIGRGCGSNAVRFLTKIATLAVAGTEFVSADTMTAALHRSC